MSDTKTRLLMIDDDKAFCRLVTRVAEPNGFEVVATDDPETFADAARSWNPAVILLDLQMPRTDGIELLRVLSASNCTAQVVMISGMDSRTLDSAVRLGTDRGLRMAGTLHKPVAVQDLRDLLVGLKPVESVLTAHDLGDAIAANQLFLEYQPKVDCRRGQVTGVEALVRWRHPRFGLIRPDQFIPLAEETGLIDPLTDWVVATAVEQCAAWQGAGLLLDVAINVSAKNLHDIHLPDRLAEQCQQFGINRSSLAPEPTETSAMSDAVQMMDVLTRLRIKDFKL